MFALCASFCSEERDELLQCLLVAASIDGETVVIDRLAEWLVVHAG